MQKSGSTSFKTALLDPMMTLGSFLYNSKKSSSFLEKRYSSTARLNVGVLDSETTIFVPEIRDGYNENTTSLIISLTVGCGKTTSCTSFNVISCSMAMHAP